MHLYVTQGIIFARRSSSLDSSLDLIEVPLKNDPSSLLRGEVAAKLTERGEHPRDPLTRAEGS